MILENNKCWGGDCSKYSEDFDQLREQSVAKVYMNCPIF